LAAPCSFGDWKAWRQSREFAQALSDMAEAQAGLEPLHQAEHIALSAATSYGST